MSRKRGREKDGRKELGRTVHNAQQTSHFPQRKEVEEKVELPEYDENGSREKKKKLSTPHSRGGSPGILKEKDITEAPPPCTKREAGGEERQCQTFCRRSSSRRERRRLFVSSDPGKKGGKRGKTHNGGGGKRRVSLRGSMDSG